ncbi:menaquinone biosynthesis protein [Pedobacter aquae]|uniref:Chorismate dehydratase n=1 Tax=Pedobacter aquae TaxID=2605747 RepID=A0A5C0VJX6_9SPHI|nr:menaquinone biosynthesis protein [Pedobacter aquae]QEK51510.1 menaquinone biosynthesis protein [Pedobacter aquae]
MIRVSAVSYTNTLPFIYGLAHHPVKEEIQLTVDYPALCAQKLIDDEADIGLIPVASLLKLPEYHLVSDYCIGANGIVNSVYIFSNCPVEEIEFLQLDPESNTSNNLAFVLLKHYFKVNPVRLINAVDYGELKHPKTAFVQIGDRTFGKQNQYPYAYDLAQEWKNFTGLPFVFAAWVSNKKLPEKFVNAFNDALKHGLDNRKEVFKTMQMRANFDLEDYLLHKIDYPLDTQKREALALFLNYVKALS